MKMRRLIGDFYFTLDKYGVLFRQPILLRGRKCIAPKFDYELMHFDTVEELITYLEERRYVIKNKTDIEVEDLIEKIYKNFEVVHYKIDIEKMVEDSKIRGISWHQRLGVNKYKKEVREIEEEGEI